VIADVADARGCDAAAFGGSVPLGGSAGAPQEIKVAAKTNEANEKTKVLELQVIQGEIFRMKSVYSASAFH
jgi:hypothetical protein